ncbi:DegV family protein with EDD domain [Salirhabdus euzebyi]|uniref:DegV family protein with EDD domain n=1 Tax=Salirhabdus euzebyi TaxID=394506 RepID=A0A841PV10_9BACI|nr:DegV family protein [Salirhabdus euzebyi]MBB6452640.1 DegV family protein with EDD domain [Salirhabdus euzebyi]
MPKKKIAFVTDSTAFLTEELRAHPDVYVVPIVVISEGREYEDLVDLSSEELYDIIRNNKEVPKTSQPSVGKFAELYEKLKEEYDHALAIHVSGKLSGTVSSSTSGKEHVGFSVEVVDSLNVSYGITTLIETGMEMAEQGLEVKEIANKLREKVSGVKSLISLGSLEQLYKGGRMSGAQYLLGNVLKIKPILTVNEDGELVLFERVRSEKKAALKIIELIKQSCEENNVEKIGIMHANLLDKATDFKNKVEEVVSDVKIVIGEISSSVAVHAGEGSLAIFWYEGRE